MFCLCRNYCSLYSYKYILIRQFNDLNVHLLSYLGKMRLEDLKSYIFDVSLLNSIFVSKITLRLCRADVLNIWDAAAP